MRSALTQNSTNLGITDVRDVQVGEVVDDGAGGLSARSGSSGNPQDPLVRR